MSEQRWADASTQNCVWLLQQREWPPLEENCEGVEDGYWRTEGVFLHRLEAYETAARRLYHYGKKGEDWRIYGVPCHGKMLEMLGAAGVNQEYIDANVAHYEAEKAEWEKEHPELKAAK